MTIASLGHRLEQYTIKQPQEVLLVSADIDGEADQVAIFRGFSSSLMRATAYDPDIPVLPDSATITTIDRIQGPYDPANPVYIEQGLTVDDLEPLLQQVGV